VICVFNIPAITWTLTAVLLLGGSYHLLQALRSRQLTDRVNKSLHALMNVLMAAMLWNLVPSTLLVQIAVLAGAALWFIIQAVARPEFKLLCAGRQGRLKCVYHSLSMAGAALMVAMMGQAAAAGHGAGPAHQMPMPMPATHHGMAAASQSLAAPTFAHSPALAIPPAIFFTAAAVVFLILLLRHRAAANTRRPAAAPRAAARTDHGLEALGAAAMALMFTTMSA
jgi:hypothetical protein